MLGIIGKLKQEKKKKKTWKSDAMQVNIVAVVVLAAYYGVLVGLSAWSSRRGKKRAANRVNLSYGNAHDEALSPGFVRLTLANRNIPLFLGVSSMTATWVGGGYLNGTAEAVFKHGLLSTQVPIGYAISLIFGGLFFSHKMRATRSFTMLDPFQQLYGRWIGLLLCLPALCGELFWSAAVLAALGQATEVIAGLSSSTCIVLSSLIYATCTCAGGLPAVVNTDAFHFLTAFVGLVYFQRVLSTATVFEAQMLSYVSAVGCLMFAVPPILIASTSRHSSKFMFSYFEWVRLVELSLGHCADFTAAGYPGPASLKPQDQASVLPFAIRYLCPGVVSVMGMAAVVGAVMSSADSSALSASTLVTRNVYQALFKTAASERELVKVLRLAVCLATAVATSMALSVTSVFALWAFSSEMVYVLLFPQLIGLFYMPKWTNSYGSVASASSRDSFWSSSSDAYGGFQPCKCLKGR
ncbi:high-affinity choline transporter 1-like [Dermacentor silvarum]|uniref:high-affinity choline transporter 1-like n=1 Tax=Dermacentor silvarum TaxID=543639 RepID=UPI002100890E|nr:high-affinity choline transporter 1-like [Dermacentor silvarum]